MISVALPPFSVLGSYDGVAEPRNLTGRHIESDGRLRERIAEMRKEDKGSNLLLSLSTELVNRFKYV